jgi:monothiol glutaredoxin
MIASVILNSVIGPACPQKGSDNSPKWRRDTFLLVPVESGLFAYAELIDTGRSKKGRIAVLANTGQMMEILDAIREQIDSNPVLLYMKGSPEQPQCGFSAQATQVLMACGERFAYIDILANPDIRANLPQVSEWPTFPQLFVAGELVGGCDIIVEMYQSGELQPMIAEAAVKEES